jgi:tRNA1(Val) A37 N6-methylase TrmN6
MTNRVSAIESDIALPFSRLDLPPFSSAMANPPYFDDENALRGPHPAKRRAWISREGLDRWITYLCDCVEPGGVVTIIHRADRLSDLLRALSRCAGSLQIRPVQSYCDAPAKRVIVRAVRSGRGPLRLLPAIVMHARDGAKHTRQAEAVLRGDDGIEWL